MTKMEMGMKVKMKMKMRMKMRMKMKMKMKMKVKVKMEMEMELKMKMKTEMKLKMHMRMKMKMKMGMMVEMKMKMRVQISQRNSLIFARPMSGAFRKEALERIQGFTYHDWNSTPAREAAAVPVSPRTSLLSSTYCMKSAVIQRAARTRGVLKKTRLR